MSSSLHHHITVSNILVFFSILFGCWFRSSLMTGALRQGSCCQYQLTPLCSPWELTRDSQDTAMFLRSAIVGRAFCFLPNSSYASQKQSAGCEVTIVWRMLGFFCEGFFKYVGMGFSQLNINSLGSLPMTLTPSSFSKVPFYVTTDKPVFKDFFGKGRMGRPT